MRAWLLLLGGMVVWAVHFFLLYALASLWGSSSPARIGTGLVTIACLAANAGILMLCIRTAKTHDAGTVIGWPARLGAPVASLSLVSVAWQGLPAILV